MKPTSITEPHLIVSHLFGEYIVKFEVEYGNELIQLLIISSIINAQKNDVKKQIRVHFLSEEYNSSK